MVQNNMRSGHNRTAPSNKLLSEVLYIANVQSYIENIKSLAISNPDWNLTPTQVVSNGKAGRKIYRINFVNTPVSFSSVQGSPDSLYVVVDGKIVGLLDSNSTSKLKQLISTTDVHRISCVIRGGVYKIVDSNLNESSHQSDLVVAIKIAYRQQTANATPTPTEKQISKKSGFEMAFQKLTKRNPQSKNRPFYKRWWFWCIIVLLIIGFIGGNSDSNESEEAVPPVTSSVQSEVSPETSALPSTSPSPLFTPKPSDSATPEPSPSNEPTAEPAPSPEIDNSRDYILNTNSKKFHNPGCSSVSSMNDINKKSFHGTRQEVINSGYEPCGRCNP